MNSLDALSANVWSRHVATVPIRRDEASLEHRLDGLLVLRVGLLSSLDLLELDMEAVDGLELVLDGILLGERGGLLVQDLLLRPSPLARDLHPRFEKMG